MPVAVWRLTGWRIIQNANHWGVAKGAAADSRLLAVALQLFES